MHVGNFAGRMLLFLTSVLLLTANLPVYAQSAPAGTNIRFLDNADMRVDGILDEAVWQTLDTLGELRVTDPDTLEPSSFPTQTRLFYTADGLYIGVNALQPAGTHLARLSSRDADINRDGITVFLDTSGDARYGYFFGVNLGGTLIDGTLLPERQLSSLWDGPWTGEVQETADGYQVEMFLPWSMMAMPALTTENRKLGIGISRRAAWLDESWSWPALPESQARFLSGLHPVVLEELTEASTEGLIFYPAISGTANRIRSDQDLRAGADIYWRPGSNMQISASLLPDFGVVESDDVVINLTAFETFFPEKRPFFLEGNEIFITSPRSAVRSAATSTGARQVSNNFALEPTTLLNTRRIGGAPERLSLAPGLTVADHELSKPSELYGASKITGQQGALRYGLMLASEEDTSIYARNTLGQEVALQQVGRDFGVLRLLYENTNNGRRSIGMMSTVVDHPDSRAQTNGVDLHYVSPRSRLIGDVQLINSDVNGVQGNGVYLDVNYVPQQGTLHRFSFDYLDDKLDVSDLGFLRRNDISTLRHTFNQQSSASERFRFVNHNITTSYERNTAGRMVGASLYYRNTLTFQSRNQLNTTLIFRPERWDDRTSKGNGNYRFVQGGQVDVAYGTDTSKTLSSSIGFSASTEAFGDVTYQSKLGLTYKPNDRLSVDVDLTYRQTDDWLIHLSGATLGSYDARQWQPEIDVSLFLSARQQLQFSLQWVGIKGRTSALWRAQQGYSDLQQIGIPAANLQSYDLRISRATAQIRYRWELAPLSDLFIVYTRGGNVPRGQADDFNELFTDALTDPIIDRLVIKLRYRFGL
ncbi:hypothetical protein E3V39_12380 [Gammaproteobacteria bacterium LSUCC0112]|nr:hypothetical protein E3V39_12380 [Gammaproteobacteria bacterium LSUCC0112]